jgi:predicted AAA+ superfamily ATPase
VLDLKRMQLRTLDIMALLDKKSHFLFGPRGTGKTTLIREQIGADALSLDLLNSDFFLRLSARPAELEQIIAAQPLKLIAIDEVQKLPILLDEVHRLIEEKKYCFLLTGSSARKLRRGGANLLAGRAWIAELMPLTSNEIDDFNIEKYLKCGGLPAVYYSRFPEDELKAYLQTYLTEEIAAEGLVRDLPLFSRFLAKSSLTNGQILNYSEIAGDLGLSPTTVREYYRILEDTLLGFMLEPFRGKGSRKEVATSKFYFFDVGVAAAIRKISRLGEGDEYKGSRFEHFIVQELRAAISYFRIGLPIMFWRTHQQHEVDVVVPDILAIEVKSAKSVNKRMVRGLKHFSEQYKFKYNLVVSNDPVDRIEDGIAYIHYQRFLKSLWAREYF